MANKKKKSAFESIAKAVDASKNGKSVEMKETSGSNSDKKITNIGSVGNAVVQSKTTKAANPDGISIRSTGTKRNKLTGNKIATTNRRMDGGVTHQYTGIASIANADTDSYTYDPNRAGGTKRAYTAYRYVPTEAPKTVGADFDSQFDDNYSKMLYSRDRALYDAAENDPKSLTPAQWVNLACNSTIGKSGTNYYLMASTSDQNTAYTSGGNGIESDVLGKITGAEDNQITQYNAAQDAKIDGYLKMFADSDPSEEEFNEAVGYISSEIERAKEYGDSNYVTYMTDLLDKIYQAGVDKHIVSAIDHRIGEEQKTVNEQKGIQTTANIEAEKNSESYKLNQRKNAILAELNSGNIDYDRESELRGELDSVNYQLQLAYENESFEPEKQATTAAGRRAESMLERLTSERESAVKYNDFMANAGDPETVQAAAEFYATVPAYDPKTSGQYDENGIWTSGATRDQYIANPIAVLRAEEDAQYTESGKLRDDNYFGTDTTEAECAYYMTDAQRTKYFALREQDVQNGTALADEYFELLMDRELLDKRREGMNQVVSEAYEESSPVKRVLGNIASLHTNFLGQIMSSFLGMGGDYNANNTALDMLAATSTYRNETRADLSEFDQAWFDDETVPEWQKGIVRFLTNGQGFWTGVYDDAMNIGDNLYRGMWTSGLQYLGYSKAAASIINNSLMGVTSFGESLYTRWDEQKEYGYTYEEYVTRCFGDALNEFAQETVLGKFEYNMEIPPKTWAEVPEYVAKCIADEAMEEGFGAYFDVALDLGESWYYGNETELEKAKQDYMKNGHYTEEEAQVLTYLEYLLCTPVASAGAGAVTGGFMSGATGAQSAFKEAANNRDTGADIASNGPFAVNATIQGARDAGLTNEADAYAQQLKDAGFDVSAYDNRALEMMNSKKSGAQQETGNAQQETAPAEENAQEREKLPEEVEAEQAEAELERMQAELDQMENASPEMDESGNYDASFFANIGNITEAANALREKIGEQVQKVSELKNKAMDAVEKLKSEPSNTVNEEARAEAEQAKDMPASQQQETETEQAPEAENTQQGKGSRMDQLRARQNALREKMNAILYGDTTLRSGQKIEARQLSDAEQAQVDEMKAELRTIGTEMEDIANGRSENTPAAEEQKTRPEAKTESETTVEQASADVDATSEAYLQATKELDTLEKQLQDAENEAAQMTPEMDRDGNYSADMMQAAAAIAERIQGLRDKVAAQIEKINGLKENMRLAMDELQRIRKEAGAKVIDAVGKARAAAENSVSDKTDSETETETETEEEKALAEEKKEAAPITDEQRQAAIDKLEEIQKKLDEYFKSRKNLEKLGRLYNKALETLGAKIYDEDGDEAKKKIVSALGSENAKSDVVVEALTKAALGTATEDDMRILETDVIRDLQNGGNNLLSMVIVDMIGLHNSGNVNGRFTRQGQGSDYSEAAQQRMKMYEQLYSAANGTYNTVISKADGNEAGKGQVTVHSPSGDVVASPTGKFKAGENGLMAEVKNDANGDVFYTNIGNESGVSDEQAGVLNTIRTFAGTDAGVAESLWSGYAASGYSDAYGDMIGRAYQYGRAGMTEDQMIRAVSPNAKTQDAVKQAYKIGAESSKTRNARAKNAAKGDDRGGRYTAKVDGKNYDLTKDQDIERFATENGLNKNQKAALKVLSKFAKTRAVNIELFRSKADDNGVITDENGSYDNETNTIRIDINAGMDQSGQEFLKKAMGRVFSHELTHYIQSNNEAGYSKLTAAVMQALSSNGYSFTALVNRQMRFIDAKNKTDQEIYDEAVDEVVANACEMMLKDSAIAEDIAREANRESRSLGQKILDFIRDFLDDIKKAFAGVASNSYEARLLKNNEKAFSEVQKIWDEALKGAMQNAVSEGIDQTKASEDGIAVSGEIARIMDSDQTEDPNKRESIRSTVEWRRAHMQNYPADMSFEQVSSLVEQLDEKVLMSDVLRMAVPHGIVNDVRQERDAQSVVGAKREGSGDKFGKSNIGPLRSNEEYGFTFDLDTKCERTYNYLYLRDQIQRNLGRQLTSFEARQLIELMRADGRYMIPCTYCYVEGKRMMLVDGYVKTITKESKKSIGRKVSPSDLFKAVEATRTIVSGYMDDRFNKDENYTVDKKTAVYKDGKEVFGGYRDFWMPSGVKVSDIVRDICEQYGVPYIEKQSKEVTDAMTKEEKAAYKFSFGAQRVIEQDINEWIYNHKLDVPMNLSDTETDWRTGTIDYQLLNMHSRGVIAAQGGVKANVVKNYKPYTDELSRVTNKEREHMNAMGGARIHSSNDFQVGNMQDYLLFFSDLAAGRSKGQGWYVHTYSKNLTFADIFSRFNARINCSVAFFTDKNGKVVPNEFEGCNQEQLQKLRQRNRNIGAMAMVVDNAQLAYALNSDWVDMIIPFHASGMPAEMFYDVMGWQNYTAIQGEKEYSTDDMKRVIREKLGYSVKIPNGKDAVSAMYWRTFNRVKADRVPTTSSEAEALLGSDFIVRLEKKNSKGNIVEYCPHFFPYDSIDSNGNFVPGHYNDADRYKALCELYGGKPRFHGLKIWDEAQQKTVDVTDHTNYVKLIKEAARTDSDQEYISMDDITNPSDEEGKSAWDRINEAMDTFNGYKGFNQDPGDLQHRFIRDYVGENGEPIIGTAKDVQKGKAKFTVGSFVDYDRELSDRNKAISDGYYEQRDERVNDLHEKTYEAELAGDKKEAKKIMDQHNVGANPIKSQGDVRKSSRIKIGMTEDERYSILSKTSIASKTFEISDSSSSYFDELYATNPKSKSANASIIKKIARNNNALGFTLTTPVMPGADIRMSSANGFNESMNKELRYSKNFHNLAKAFENIHGLLDNSVLIETHNDKYTGTWREDKNLEDVHVLFSVLEDGNNLIPVQMEIKKDKRVNYYNLYMYVALNEIEKTGVMEKGKDQNPRLFLLPVSEYSISQIFREINPEDNHLLKYIPEKFLSDEQKEAKKIAIEEDRKRRENLISETEFDEDGNVIGRIPKEKRAEARRSARERQNNKNEPTFSDESTGESVRYSLREAPAPRRTIKCYKAFDVVDGKLYPPMVKNDADNSKMGSKPSTAKNKKTGAAYGFKTNRGLETPWGVWLDADVGAMATDPETGEALLNNRGRPYVVNSKGGTLSFRPGWHLGGFPSAAQFLITDKNGNAKSAQRDDVVYAECEIAADYDYQLEALSYGYVGDNGKYFHNAAGLPMVPVDGFYKYRTNPTDGEPWFITGAIKITKILTDEECRQRIAEYNEENGTDYEFPQRYSGKDIDLKAMFGEDFDNNAELTAPEDLTPYRKTERSYANDQFLNDTLERIKGISAEIGNPNYGYVSHSIDFNDPDVLQAFETNKTVRSAEEYRKIYEQQGTERYDGEVTGTGERFSKRTGEITDRDLLKMASDAVAQTETEKSYLAMYKEATRKLVTLNQDMQAENESMQRYRAAGNTEEVTKSQNRIRIMRNQMDELIDKTTALEESKPLSGVMFRIRHETEEAVLEALTQVRAAGGSVSGDTSAATDAAIEKALREQARKYQIEIVTLKDRIKQEQKKAAEAKNGPDPRTRRGKAPDTKKLIDSYEKRIRQLETRIATMDNGAAKQLAKEVQKRENAIQNIRDRRKATETRQKIRRIIDNFNQRLAHPRENRYIPADMIRGIISALESFDLSYVRNGEEVVGKAIRDMYDVYDKYKKDGEYTFYNSVIAGRLEALAEEMGNTKFRNMNSKQLDKVYEHMKELYDIVDNAVKFKTLKGYKDAYEAGDRAIEQVEAAEPMVNGKAGELLNWMSSPDNFFKRISGFVKGAVLSEMQKEFVNGEQRMLEIQREYVNTFAEYTSGQDFKNLGKHKAGDLVDVGLVDMNLNEEGEHEPVMITRGMMLSLYMHLMCDDNIRGIARGGLKIPNLTRYYEKNPAAAFDDVSALRTVGIMQRTDGLYDDYVNSGLDEKMARIETAKDRQAMEDNEIAQLNKIRQRIWDMMTEDERGMTQAAHVWFDQKSRAYLNEVSMDMYGFKVAAVENYFPIHRDANFLNTQFQSIANDASLANMGFLKERVKASQPILLMDFAYEMASSVDQTSRYVGFARAERDFNLLYKAQLPGMTTSLREQIGKKFHSGDQKIGVTGMQYIENYVNSIIGNNRSKATIWDDIRSNLARSTLTLNPRVALSQAASIPTAVAELDMASVTKAMKDFMIAFNPKAKEQLAQDDIWFWQRYRGEGGMTEFSDAKKNGTKLDRIYNTIADTKVGKRLMNWCQDFDVGSTAIIHKATEYWVTGHTGYAQGSEEWKQAVADKYRDVLRRTQPMYTTTARSDLMRSSDGIMKTFTMFKTQAAQNLNTLYNASAEFRKFKMDFEKGINGVTAEDVRDARDRFVNSIRGVAMGAVAYAVLRFLVNWLFGKLKKYKDEDTDEMTVMSTVKGVGLEALSSLASMVAFGSEAWSFGEAVITGGKYYGISETAVGQIGELAESIVKMSKSVGTDKFGDRAMTVFNDLSGVLGIPSSNVENLYNAVTYYVNGVTSGVYESAATKTDNSYYNRMISAMLEGNGAEYESLLAEEMKSSGKTIKEAQAGLKDRISYWYANGAMTRDEAVSLLTGEQLGLDDDDVFWMMDKADYTKKHGGKSDGYNKNQRLMDAITEGTDAAITEAIDFYKQHGFYGKDYTAVKNAVKNLYQDDKITWERAEELLVQYAGFTQTDKRGVTSADTDELYWTQQEWDWNKSGAATLEESSWNKYSALDKAVSGDDVASATEQVKYLMEHGVTKSGIASHLASMFKSYYLELLDADAAAAETYLTTVILPVYKAAGYSEAQERKYIAKKWK